MAMAHILREVAEFSIRQVLYPKLKYPLIATTLSKAECKDILKPVLNQGLPAMGINRHFLWAVVHGPLKFQGLNNLYTEQLVMHVATLLQYGIHQDDLMGQLIRANSEAMQLEAGLNGQLFQIPIAMQPCLMDTWLSRCWYQCQLLQVSVTTDIQEFEIPQHHDKEIMQIFLKDGVRGVDLAAVNRCRMYLQVVFVSENCNGEGTKIDQNYWNGKPAHLQSNYQWPCTSPPTPQEWNLWRQRLMSGLSLGHRQHLPLPLRQWQATIQNAPGYFMDITGNYLLALQNQQWYAHAKIPH